MSQALQFFRDGFGDESIIALKEWTGPNGEMGVYHSQTYDYFYLFILIDAANRKYYLQQYRDEMTKDKAFKDAEIIAAFAGAQEK